MDWFCWENLQETIDFPMKYWGFLFPEKNNPLTVASSTTPVGTVGNLKRKTKTPWRLQARPLDASAGP